MSNSFLRARSRQLCRSVMNHIMSELAESDMRRPAVVFSPHPDDETLGCGGTIIKKKRVGADVKIVFMTDGSGSHRHLIADEALKSIRASEALAASRMLGVAERDVFFLEYKSGTLSENQANAMEKVTEILKHQQPDEIFIPYYKETHVDHVATNRIIVSALKMYRRRVIIYEYPIWLWLHWPWTSLPIGSRREVLTVLKNSLISAASLLRDFKCCVYIRDVSEFKRAALDQHKSQMRRLNGEPRWLTLGDVSNGEFLECFFQEQEIFYSHSLVDV